MQEEIKEILEKLKDREETYQFCKQYKLAINDWIYEAHYLLDYITNLQQENEKYVKAYMEIKKEYEKTLNHLLIDNKAQRIDKAIEYLDNKLKLLPHYMYEKEMYDLLNILQGSDKQ